MSRVGKAPIQVPGGVSITVKPNNEVHVKGPKGELVEKIDSDIKVNVDGAVITLERPTEQKRHKAMHGLYRALINNMVTGVSAGYKKEMELVGVGFRATSSGQKLELVIGYSHPVVVLLPKEVKVATETVKGQNPKIILESADKQLLGSVCARIRGLRKPEPYKGKGIKFAGEVLRRKAGKAASAK